MALKAYLEEFFKTYDYEYEDAKVLTDVYTEIMGNPETASMFNQAIAIYDESIECDFAPIFALTDAIAEKTHIHEYTVELLTFICLSKRAKEVYISKGISLDIFHGNMLDLKYKLDECKLVYGIVGSFVASWFVGFFRVKRFSLGRLQFELSEFKYDFELDGKVLSPGSKIVNMHIPRSLKPLDAESCDEAFRMAKEFFSDEFEGEIPFYCHSWLLYTGTKKLLPENSNIYRFASRFHIVEEKVDKARNDLWRIFDTMEKNPDNLPENSSLQKIVKEHLKNGGKMGYGAGVFFL